MRRPSLPIGSLLPRLLAVVFLLDLGLRLLPTKTFCYRGWEALTVNLEFPKLHFSEGPFKRHKTYSNPRTYGDLSALSNLPDRRHYRNETFVTDEFGYRNPPGLTRQEPVSAVLLGDSFVAGAGNSDEFVLPAALRKKSGVVAYNAAGDLPRSLQDILAPVEAAGLREGWVIYEHLERVEKPFKLEGPRERWKIRFWKKFFPLLGRENGLWARQIVSHRFAVSPVKILSAKFLKAFSDDRFFPNSYAKSTVQKRLVTGDVFLFQPQEIEKFHTDRSALVAPWKTFFLSLSEELARRNLKLMVLLVPEKYTVYEPLLGRGTAAGEKPLYLDALGRELKAGGLPTVNLAPLFRQKAAELASKKIYLYWPDDTHWTPLGISLAAGEISKILAPDPAGPAARLERK